jgi:hypothetical protein
VKLNTRPAHPRRKWTPKDPATARFRRAQQAAESLGGVVPIHIHPRASRLESEAVAHVSTPDEKIALSGPQAPTVAKTGEDVT